MSARYGYAFAGWRGTESYLCAGGSSACEVDIPASVTAYDATGFMTAEFYHQPALVYPGVLGIENNLWQANAFNDNIGLFFASDFDDDGDDDVLIAAETNPAEEFSGVRAGLILTNDGDGDIDNVVANHGGDFRDESVSVLPAPEFLMDAESGDHQIPATDAVLDEVVAWQNRPLEPVYAIVYFDALRVKIRDEGLVRNKAVYLAIGITCNGYEEVLGLWIEQTEGAKFWLRVTNELKARGRTGSVRGRPLRGTLRRRGAQLAPALGGGDPVFRLLSGGTQDLVHDQRD